MCVHMAGLAARAAADGIEGTSRTHVVYGEERTS